MEGRQAGRPPSRGAAGSHPNIKAEVSHLHLQQTTSIEGKKRDVGEEESCNSETLPINTIALIKVNCFTILMDSYVTYLQIISAECDRSSLLQLPPSPVSSFSLYGCCLLQMQVWGTSTFILGGACRAVGLPTAPPPGGRGLHAIELKF